MVVRATVFTVSKIELIATKGATIHFYFYFTAYYNSSLTYSHLLLNLMSSEILKIHNAIVSVNILTRSGKRQKRYRDNKIKWHGKRGRRIYKALLTRLAASPFSFFSDIRSLRDCHKKRISVEDWQLYRLYENEGLAHNLITTSALTPILSHCYRNSKTLSNIFDDKALFHQYCRESGIETAPIFALVKNDDFSLCDIESIDELLDADDLFIKPVDGVCGKGAFKLTKTATGFQDHETRNSINRRNLKDYLLNMARKFPAGLIVQPCIANHSDLKKLTGTNALATLRVVTCRIGNTPKLVAATLRCPPGIESSTDNYAQGGICINLDLNKNALGSHGYQKGSAGPKLHSCHPVSGVEFSGIYLPHANAAKKLVLNAHANCLSDAPSVGWDIAITQSQALILEANPIWCPDVIQLPLQDGLLSTSFREHLLEELCSTI
jgi:succinate dehydrogenase flavin-adding protein (antitoxin of CptAB toxin-antitoxin module)